MMLREYQEADLDACLAVFDSNVRDYFVPEERAEYIAFLDGLPGPYFVVEGDGAVIACGGYARKEDGVTVDLCWGMVLRSQQGKGLGRRLTAERIARARAEPGVRVIRLATSQLTTGFYEGVGFVIEKRVANGYAPGIDRCDMRLELNPDVGAPQQ